jgi:type IV fimbrial biogenesis protein FimT
MVNLQRSSDEGMDMNDYLAPGLVPAGKSEGGFSLIELMIGVLLVAILMGIGVPSFRSMIEDQRLRAVTTDLRLALNMTRSEAVKRNRTVVLSPGADGWGGGWTIANPVDPNDPDILNQIHADGLTITGPATVSFNAMGRSTATEFDIEIDSASGAAMCLQMRLDGGATALKGICP